MNNITMKLSEMVKPERNVRIHTEQQLREFERSVKMFGQIRPIVVDEKNVILAGNGLYETLIRMGYEEALVYQLTDLTENQKKKLMMQSNEIFNLAEEQGISRRTLENAKKEFGIRAKRINNSWYWELNKIRTE